MQKALSILKQGLERSGINYHDKQIEQCMFIVEQLLLWNRKINLTAITVPEEVVVKHLLDSLVLLPELRDYQMRSDSKNLSILDVGTGAGFPALPLAIFTPDFQYYPLDSNSKKLSFIRRVSNQLKLSNVETIHSRIQDLRPDQPYSVITARAFAEINKLLGWLPVGSYDQRTEVWAMKGKLPGEELLRLEQSLQSPKWILQDMVTFNVPGLEADRCMLRFKKAKDSVLPPVDCLDST